MGTNKSRSESRERRHQRVRKHIKGTPAMPRLNVFRSLAEIYAQVIDDEAGQTLVSASSIDGELRTSMDGKKKTLNLDKARLDQVRRLLGLDTDTGAIHAALDSVIESEAMIDDLMKVAGRGKGLFRTGTTPGARRRRAA